MAPESPGSFATPSAASSTNRIAGQGDLIVVFRIHLVLLLSRPSSTHTSSNTAFERLSLATRPLPHYHSSSPCPGILFIGW